MAGLTVEVEPAAAAAIAAAPGDDPRFTQGAITAAVRTALTAGSARVVEARLQADPPHVIVELAPSGDRLFFKLVDFPQPGWKLARAPVPERVVRFELPAAARGPRQMDWLIAALVDAAAALGADVRPPSTPEPNWSSEDLGMGEYRSIQSINWDAAAVHCTAEVEDGQIYDGATPGWTYLRATATGLPDDGAVRINGSIRVGPTPSGTLWLVGPRARIDAVREPSGP